jgi:hypothetical protein
MIKLIDLIETKIAARGKREFRITQKNNDDVIGDLTIGTLTTYSGQFGLNETHVSLYTGNGFRVISVFFRFRGEPSMERINEFENNLKKYGIKYRLYNEELSYVTFSILVKENNIRVVDNIDETRIVPKSRVFYATEKNDDYTYGDLTIGNLTIGNREYKNATFIELINPNLLVVGINTAEFDPDEFDILWSEYEQKFKEYGIKYTEDKSTYDYSFFMIPAKENNIRVVDNIDETKIGPRKPFILFRSIRTVNQWVDESYYFFKNNDPKQDTIGIFSKDEIEEPYLSLQFTETSIHIGKIIYLDKKIKNLPGAKIETQEVDDYKKSRKYIFSIPTKYFEIQEYPKQQ